MIYSKKTRVLTTLRHILLIAALAASLVCTAQERERRHALDAVRRMFDYAATVDTAYIEHREKYAYLNIRCV